MSETLPEFTIADLVAAGPVEFDSFTKEDAYDLGTIAGAVIRERDVNLAVDIVLDDDLVYRARFGTTGPGNDEWLTSKAATAREFGEPSLLVKLRRDAGELGETDRAFWGGSVPLFVDDTLVGTITMSGEPDVVDHATVVAAIERYRSRA